MELVKELFIMYVEDKKYMYLNSMKFSMEVAEEMTEVHCSS